MGRIRAYGGVTFPEARSFREGGLLNGRDTSRLYPSRPWEPSSARTPSSRTRPRSPTTTASSTPEGIRLSDGVELGVATGKEALAYSGSWFAKHSNRQLFSQQLEGLVKARFVIGAGIGSVADLKEKIVSLWHAVRNPGQETEN